MISRQDAQDLMEFGNAIFNYVFALTEKFNDFVARKKARESNSVLTGEAEVTTG